MTIEALILTAKRYFTDHVVQSAAILLLIAFVTYVIVNEAVRSRARVPGLGGPKGWPLIGNLWDIRTNAAEKYEEWAKTYGDVYQVQVSDRCLLSPMLSCLASIQDAHLLHQCCNKSIQAYITP